MNRHRSSSVVALVLVAMMPVACRAADLVTEVPDDALGVVHVHNLAAVEQKIVQLSMVLRRNLPRPVSLLRDFANIREGINENGDAMLALFAGDDGGEPSLEFCVWLPVANYQQFLKSIHATSFDGVSAATIAGEDLLVAPRGDWAIIMDPDQRERLTKLAAANASDTAVKPWKQWFESNDVAVVALKPGVQMLLAKTGDDAPDGGNADSPVPERIRYRQRTTPRGPAPIRSAAEAISGVKTELGKWLAAAPELSEKIQQANICGVGMRSDVSGNIVASVRVGVDKELTDELMKSNTAADYMLPPALQESGGFVLSAAGHVPQQIASAYARAYVRRVAADLRNEEQTELDETAFTRLLDAVEKVAGEVQSIAVLSQPGQKPQPVYSNEFMAVRVQSASNFSGQAREAMRLWNSASRSAKGDTKLVFDVEESKIGDRAATLYSLDVAALDGQAVLPEVRQIMEQMFGPGGKLRLWIVPLDDTTVLLASATPDQVADAVKLAEQKKTIAWIEGELAEIARMLPGEADWRGFVDLHRYFDWKRRESTAMIGVPVIGGPMVRDFPSAPPVAVAGGVREGEVWANVAALAPTIKSAGDFLSGGTGRGRIQIRVQPPARQVVPQQK